MVMKDKDVGLRLVFKGGVTVIQDNFGVFCWSNDGCDCGINKDHKSLLDQIIL